MSPHPYLLLKALTESSVRREQEIVSIWHSAVWQKPLYATHWALPWSVCWSGFPTFPYLEFCHLLTSASPIFLLSLFFHVLYTPLSFSTSLNIHMSPTLLFLWFLLSSLPCLSPTSPPMFPPGDPLSIHHYFHGYLAGFTVRPGSLESREVIECLYACREGLDYSDFDSLGKGMKVCPSAQLAWVSSTLLPSLASQDFACSHTSDNCPRFSSVSLLAWVHGVC